MQNELETQKGVGNFQFISNWLSHTTSFSSSPSFPFQSWEYSQRTHTYKLRTPHPTQTPRSTKSPQLEAKLAEPVHDL